MFTSHSATNAESLTSSSEPLQNANDADVFRRRRWYLLWSGCDCVEGMGPSATDETDKNYHHHDKGSLKEASSHGRLDGGFKGSVIVGHRRAA